jgi:hypothetical protein
MGVVQSVAQGVVNKVSVRLGKSTIFNIPDQGDEPLTGVLQAVVEIENHDDLGALASTKATTASLEMPVVKGFEQYAGIFGHFTLPALKIGMGTKQHSFTAELTLTNKSTLIIWALSMGLKQVGGGFPLNIRADPVVSVAGVDPVTVVLRLDKELLCKPILPPTTTTLPPTQNGAYDSAYDGVINNISMTCDYLTNAPARPKGDCSSSDDCQKAMNDHCSEDGGWACETCLALHTAHLSGNGCSTDPLELASSSDCFCHGKCGVTSHCLSHMEKICKPGKGPICDLCLTAHIADMMLIGGCGPIKSLTTQKCYCYGGFGAQSDDNSTIV